MESSFPLFLKFKYEGMKQLGGNTHSFSFPKKLNFSFPQNLVELKGVKCSLITSSSY